MPNKRLLLAKLGNSGSQLRRNEILARITLAALVLLSASLVMFLLSSPTKAGSRPAVDISVASGGYAEYRVGTERFPKWRALVERHVRGLDQSGADDANKNHDEYRHAKRAWDTLVGDLLDGPRERQIERVNAFFNGLKHAPDIKIWNSDDYWASPLEFLTRSRGDCEDFAAAKYFALRAAGFDLSELRLAVVLVSGRTEPTAHAILLVSATGTILALDDLSDRPRPFDSLQHYRLIYSLNEDDAWVHIRTPERVVPLNQGS